jgi:hypothetical protein
LHYAQQAILDAVPFSLFAETVNASRQIQDRKQGPSHHNSLCSYVAHAQPLFLPLPRTISLELSGDALGELERDVAAGEAAVDVGVGVEAVVDAAALLLVEDDLEGLVAVLLGAETLADDLDGVDEVGQDGVVHGREGARAGALLLLGVARAGAALGGREDAARGEEQDVAVRELLLQLTGEAASCQFSPKLDDVISTVEGGNSPLLDTVEALQGRDGDKDDNRLLAVANFDLIKTQSQHASSRMYVPTILGPLPVLFHGAIVCSRWYNLLLPTGGQAALPIGFDDFSSRKHPTALETCASCF